MGYIYLLRTREFINAEQNIYKIGRTQQTIEKRFSQYPKGSELIFHCECEDPVKIESQIIKKFKLDFNQRDDIGNEYFEGDVINMISIIKNTINANNKKILIDINCYSELLYNTEIRKIIIKDKSNVKGFIKFDNLCWIEFGNDKTETLDGFIKKQLKNHNLCGDISKIIKDISTKCQSSDNDIYQKKAYEYILPEQSDNVFF